MAGKNDRGRPCNGRAEVNRGHHGLRWLLMLSNVLKQRVELMLLLGTALRHAFCTTVACVWHGP